MFVVIGLSDDFDFAMRNLKLLYIPLKRFFVCLFVCLFVGKDNNGMFWRKGYYFILPLIGVS